MTWIWIHWLAWERGWLRWLMLSVTDTMLWSQDCKFHFLSPSKNIFITFWTLIKRHFLSRSDSNSYFPVGPCEYGGPLQALMAGDANAGGFSSSYCPRFKKSFLSSWPLNLCRVSFPAGRAREDPSAQHLRAGLVPQDGDDQDEEDDARPRAICLRLWHPHWGIPTLYTVSGWRWQ